MIRRRCELLGLCAAVLSLMVLGTTTARAESGAQWLLARTGGGGQRESVSFLPAEVTLSGGTAGVLHSKISGVAVLFECPTITAVNVKLQKNGSIGKEFKGKETSPVGSKIKFSLCKTRLNGVLSAACEPNFGTIETASGHGLIVLHELVSGVKHPFVQFLPDNVINGKGEEVKSETLATIEMSEECAIGTKVPVIGRVFGKTLVASALSTLEFGHLIEVSTLLTEVWTISKTAEHAASLLGSATASLWGEHLNYLYAGDPA